MTICSSLGDNERKLKKLSNEKSFLGTQLKSKKGSDQKLLIFEPITGGVQLCRNLTKVITISKAHIVCCKSERQWRFVRSLVITRGNWRNFPTKKASLARNWNRNSWEWESTLDQYYFLRNGFIRNSIGEFC